LGKGNFKKGRTKKKESQENSLLEIRREGGAWRTLNQPHKGVSTKKQKSGGGARKENGDNGDDL